MQTEVFKQAAEGVLYQTKEAKAAWLKVLQGLKGTAKAQSKMRELANLWGSGSRTRDVASTIERMKVAPGQAPDFIKQLRTYRDGLDSALGSARKGVYNKGNRDVLKNLRESMRARFLDPSGAATMKGELKTTAQPTVIRNSNIGPGFIPSKGEVHLASPARQADAVAEARAPFNTIPAVWSEKAVLPHELGHWRQVVETPQQFARNTRLGLNDMLTTRRRLGIRPASFWDDAYHQADSSATWGDTATGRISPAMRAFESTANTRAAHDALAYGGPNQAHTFRIGTALQGTNGLPDFSRLVRQHGAVANTPFWRGLSGINQLRYNYKLPYVPNTRHLP